MFIIVVVVLLLIRCLLLPPMFVGGVVFGSLFCNALLSVELVLQAYR